MTFNLGNEIDNMEGLDIHHTPEGEIVLTMISGARELMTPGAWERNGVTYRLSESRGGGK